MLHVGPRPIRSSTRGRCPSTRRRNLLDRHLPAVAVLRLNGAEPSRRLRQQAQQDPPRETRPPLKGRPPAALPIPRSVSPRHRQPVPPNDSGAPQYAEPIWVPMAHGVDVTGRGAGPNGSMPAGHSLSCAPSSASNLRMWLLEQSERSPGERALTASTGGMDGGAPGSLAQCLYRREEGKPSVQASPEWKTLAASVERRIPRSHQVRNFPPGKQILDTNRRRSPRRSPSMNSRPHTASSGGGIQVVRQFTPNSPSGGCLSSNRGGSQRDRAGPTRRSRLDTAPSSSSLGHL